MFNLNDEKEFNTGKSIFNGGEAGKVDNVSIRVEKKQDSSNQPDYKLFASDGLGEINEGFYYPTPNPQKNEEDNNKIAKMHVGRVLHAAKAVMGEDYVFPEVSSAQEAYDTLFKLIKENSEGKKFNVYATYGTKDRPSQYLGFRFFNFIEPAGNEKTTLYPNIRDMMEKLNPDVPTADTSGWL